MGVKFVKFKAHSFLGKGAGLSYFGISFEKGIDPGIRSIIVVAIRIVWMKPPYLGDTEAFEFENMKRQGWTTFTNLTREKDYTEITICVRFKFTLYLQDRLA